MCPNQAHHPYSVLPRRKIHRESVQVVDRIKHLQLLRVIDVKNRFSSKCGLLSAPCLAGALPAESVFFGCLGNSPACLGGAGSLWLRLLSAPLHGGRSMPVFSCCISIRAFIYYKSSHFSKLLSIHFGSGLPFSGRVFFYSFLRFSWGA